MFFYVLSILCADQKNDTTANDGIAYERFTYNDVIYYFIKFANYIMENPEIVEESVCDPTTQEDIFSKIYDDTKENTIPREFYLIMYDNMIKEKDKFKRYIMRTELCIIYVHFMTMSGTKPEQISDGFKDDELTIVIDKGEFNGVSGTKEKFLENFIKYNKFFIEKCHLMQNENYRHKYMAACEKIYDHVLNAPYRNDVKPLVSYVDKYFFN